MLLITGLTGRSGSAFYDLLCREKYPGKIRAVVRETTDRTIFENTPLDLELCVGDIADADFLAQAAEGCDTVFHIASKRMIQPLADAILRTRSVKNAIMVSSTIVYSNYYRCAYLGDDEQVCVRKFEHKGIKYIFIRPTMIFGTINDGNISRFIRWFLKYPVFPIVGNGQATIQPVSRLDVAEAYFLVLKNFSEIDKTEYIVSGEREMTLKEMFNSICTLADRKVLFVNIPFRIARLCVEAVYSLSAHRIDYREKLDRLMENRAYGHEEISTDLGYTPQSFETRVLPLIDELKKKKQGK